MDDFSKPTSPTVNEIAPSEYNFISPGKRPLSSMCPLILTDWEENVKHVIGGEGGPTITTEVSAVRMIRLLSINNIFPLNECLFMYSMKIYY